MNQWKAVLCADICISSVNALVVLFLDNIYTQAISHKILEKKTSKNFRLLEKNYIEYSCQDVYFWLCYYPLTNEVGKG